MAVIKVSIKDSKTLELQEDANKGDTIDLGSLSSADVSSVAEAIKIAARREAEQELEKTKAKEIEAEVLKKEKELNEKYNKQLLELEVDKNKYAQIAGKKDDEIERLKNEREQAIEKEKQSNKIEIISLKAELDKKDSAIKIELERKEAKMAELVEKMKSQETQKTFEIKQTVSDMQKEIERLKNAYDTKNKDYQLSEQKLREEYERQLKIKEEEIKEIRDYKAKQNIADFGEDLAKYCDVAFENIRLALPVAIDYFKDNDISEGTKGDRIYREYDQDGNQVLSIMFEMKDGKEETKTKQTNEKHFNKLDKDRKNKQCEYAVLVSALERDNPIFDRMYTVPQNKYQDMYVVRPQDFTNIIMWLRNVSTKLYFSRRELTVIRERDRDYTEFDKNMEIVRDKFNKHMNTWIDKNNSSIESIEKMIKGLQKLRDDMLGANRPLVLASGDLEDITVKKIGKNSPGILAQVKETKAAGTVEKKLTEIKAEKTKKVN
jgi:hypothetical protein